MKTFIVGLLTAAVILIANQPASAEFYYGGSGQISLRVDSLKVVIKFDNTRPQQQIFQQVTRLQQVIQDSNMVNDFQAVSIAAGGDLYAFLDTLNRTDGITAAEPYYYIDDSLAAPVGDQFGAGMIQNDGKSDFFTVLPKISFDKTWTDSLSMERISAVHAWEVILLGGGHGDQSYFISPSGHNCSN